MSRKATNMHLSHAPSRSAVPTDRYQSYINNLRRVLSSHLRSGVGVRANLTPLLSGGAVVRLDFGDGMANSDSVEEPALSLRDAVQRWLLTDASAHDALRGYVREGADELHYETGPEDILVVEQNAFGKFLEEVDSADPAATEMLLAPRTVVLVKKTDQQNLWNEQSSESDAKAIVGA